MVASEVSYAAAGDLFERLRVEQARLGGRVREFDEYAIDEVHEPPQLPQPLPQPNTTEPSNSS